MNPGEKEKSDHELREEHDRELWIDEQAYREKRYRDLKRMIDENAISFDRRELPDFLRPKPTSDLARAFNLAVDSIDSKGKDAK